MSKVTDIALIGALGIGGIFLWQAFQSGQLQFPSAIAQEQFQTHPNIEYNADGSQVRWCSSGTNKDCKSKIFCGEWTTGGAANSFNNARSLFLNEVKKNQGKSKCKGSSSSSSGGSGVGGAPPSPIGPINTNPKPVVRSAPKPTNCKLTSTQCSIIAKKPCNVKHHSNGSCTCSCSSNFVRVYTHSRDMFNLPRAFKTTVRKSARDIGIVYQ